MSGSGRLRCAVRSGGSCLLARDTRLSRPGIRSFVSTAFSVGRQARCARALSIEQRAPSPIICRSSPTSQLAEVCGGSFSRRSARLTCENSGAPGCVALHQEIDVGIMYPLTRRARADLEVDRIALGAVD